MGLIAGFNESPENIEELKIKPPTKCYLDGAFDLIHSGHYNAIRQASLLCDELVVGVCSGAEIEKAKGPTILNDDERVTIIEACKFATNIKRETAYTVSTQVLDDNDCHFYAHGDDPCYGDNGEDMCLALAEQGRYKQF
jgi:ethanolamine-phosphate cytidylyltransferase